MKKILMLIPALNAGGAERVMVTLANEWSKTNDVTIAIFHTSGSFYDLNESVHLIEMGLSLPAGGVKRKLSIPLVEFKRYRFIVKLVKNGGFDFVLSFTNITNLFTCLMARRLKNEFFVISERADPKDYSKYMKLAMDKLYRKCDLVVCQNKVVKAFFEGRGFTNRLEILPNPVCFRDIPSQMPQKREHIISTVGRLTRQKNHKLLINAFREVHALHPEYKLRIYGIGPLENELRAQIEDLSLSDCVELMGTKKKVMYDINHTEIFVLCSDYEGFPNVLIEAMAAQMPVISSNFATGVAKELISDGENGYLFEVGNQEQLVSCLNQAIARSSEFESIGRKNRILALEYRDETVAERWLETILRAREEKQAN